MLHEDQNLFSRKMIISRKNPMTGEVRSVSISITPEQLAAYESGTVIQLAAPNLTPDEREFILTGFLPEEFDALMADDDQEETDTPV